MSTELATRPQAMTAAISTVAEQIDAIHELQRKVMVKDVDFGIIPGTNKPTLMKPGAEKLCMLFKLSTKIDMKRLDMPNNHREYECKVTLARRDEDGDFFGEGVGTCSTMEKKYRWRNTARKCPSCGKEAIIKGKAEYGGGWLCWKNKGGCNAKWADGAPEIEGQQAGQMENPDVADCYNTVMKMSKKRALVDAVLTATAASHLFTQDLEEGVQDSPERTQEEKPVQASQFIALPQWRAIQAKLTGPGQDALLKHFRVKRGGELKAEQHEDIWRLINDNPDWHVKAEPSKTNGKAHVNPIQAETIDQLGQQLQLTKQSVETVIFDIFKEKIEPAKMNQAQADTFIAALREMVKNRTSDMANPSGDESQIPF